MITSRKGSNAERELLKMFLESNWGAIRIAGSGHTANAPDILAGHPGKLLVIECKSSKQPAIYVKQQEVMHVIEYANKKPPGSPGGFFVQVILNKLEGSNLTVD